MVCALGTPKRHAESGIYWFRKRVPDRLKAKVGKCEIKFSLRTRDPDVARLRNLEAMLKVERAWASYDISSIDLVTGAAVHIQCKTSATPKSETRASEPVPLEAVGEVVAELPVPLRASFESYAQEAELAPATVKRWSPVIDRLVEHLGHDDARRIARTDIVAWKSIRGPKQHMPLIEAFPNAILGVLVRAQDYQSASRGRHQSKSDWLYDRTIECGALNRVLRRLGWNQPEMLARLESEKHHDKRAALVCLLTAGFAHAGDTTIVGDVAGGWFWLPPKALWESWALEGLEEAIARSRQRGFEDVIVW